MLRIFLHISGRSTQRQLILYAAEKYGFSYLATDAENWYVKDL
jgi:hypothetical protein